MDRSQTLLLPESVEDYVSAQHPVRFLDAFVEGLDLKACGFARNMKRVINLVGMARLLEAVRRLVAATAQLLEAFLEVLSARGHPEEAEWPLAA